LNLNRFEMSDFENQTFALARLGDEPFKAMNLPQSELIDLLSQCAKGFGTDSHFQHPLRLIALMLQHQIHNGKACWRVPQSVTLCDACGQYKLIHSLRQRL
jgi:hypothetical protein